MQILGLASIGPALGAGFLLIAGLGREPGARIDVEFDGKEESI